MPYRDFDRFFNEPEPIKFTFKGKDYTVRGRIPMAAVLALRGMRTEGENDPGEMVQIMDNLISRILGKENWQQLLEDEVDFDQAQEIISYVMGEAMSSASGDEEEGEEGGPGNVKDPELPSTPTLPTGMNGKEAVGAFTISEHQNSPS